MRIPEQGWSKQQVLEALEQFRADDMPWRDGRTWAYVYDPGREAEEVIKQAFAMYLSENALDPTVFPSTLRLENELVAMAAAHLYGDEQVVGNFTSGGTESIILAVKTARDHARALQPQIREPEIVLPTTAHAAFHKAAHYLDVKVVLAPVDPKTFKADVAAVRAAITPNTILLVGSAVSYAHGVVDPIEALGQLALEKSLLLHVDGCMGGFLLPYLRRAGAPVPRFEFDVPGVTSISMDFHKYAFAAKGASAILHRNKELRRYQIYACSNWTGYTVINPTVQSTKSAGPIAAAWAVLHFIGDEGYLEIARQVLDATRRIADARRRESGPAPARTARDELGRVHLRHRERLPRDRRDEDARLVHPAAARLRRFEGEHPPLDQPGERALGGCAARRSRCVRGEGEVDAFGRTRGEDPGGIRRHRSEHARRRHLPGPARDGRRAGQRAAGAHGRGERGAERAAGEDARTAAGRVPERAVPTASIVMRR